MVRSVIRDFILDPFIIACTFSNLTTVKHVNLPMFLICRYLQIRPDLIVK